MSVVKKDLFLGIDIGAGAIKIVLLAREKNDTMRLLKAFCQEYEEGASELNPEAQLAKAAYFLKKFLHNEKILRNIKAGISIAGQSAFVRLVKIPVTAPQKLRQIVLYETQQQIPFPIKDVVWDFQVYGRDKKQLSILLAAVKKELINSILNIAFECSLDLEFIDVSNLALYNSLHYFYRDLKETLIIDCGAKTTNVIVANTGRIWTRSLPLGGEDINDALMRVLKIDRKLAEKIKKEKGQVLMLYHQKESFEAEQDRKIAEVITGILTELTNEIIKTINFYKSQHVSDMKFSKVILCGGASKIKNIDKFFENSLSASVEKMDYFNFLKFNPKMDMQLTEFLGPAIGLALRGNGMAPLNVNLLPAEHLQYKRMKKKIPYVLGSLMMIFLLLIGFFCVSLARYYSLKDYLEVLQQKAALLKANEKTVNEADNFIRRYREKMQIMRQTLSAKHALVFMLEDIALAMPGKIWIKSLNFDLEKDSISLEGISADDMDSIGDFQQKLEQQTMIKNVKIETVGKAGNNVMSFSISILLR
ncbi:MAG: type IV pilus assembly protein PilM [Candidatus Omnitrophica bacterium]|nr:type IV pilus assembly protein PilM [Candidatus Omnitrophota bacterium]